MDKRIVLLGVFLFAMAGAMTFYYLPPDIKEVLKSQVTRQYAGNKMLGKPMQAFVLNNLQGKAIASSKWMNKVLLINFWATWCPPCRREIPGFAEVREFYYDAGFEVIGIAIDDKEDVKEFLAAMPDVQYPQLIGYYDANAVAKTMGNTGGQLPYSVLVDQNNIIRFVKYGELDKALLLEKLEPLLE